MEIITKERIIKETKVKVYLSDLIFFLQQRGALRTFEQHVNWERIRVSFPEFWISCAFIWADTLEGEPFWQKVNREWKDFLKTDLSGEIHYESPFTIE